MTANAITIVLAVCLLVWHNSFSMFSYIYQKLNPVFNINFNWIQCQFKIRMKSELISSLPKNIDLIKISVCFHIPTVYMNRQLQYKLFVWIMLLHIIMYLFWSQVQVHTSNIIRKLTWFVRGIKVGYTYCCNQRVFSLFFGEGTNVAWIRTNFDVRMFSRT